MEKKGRGKCYNYIIISKFFLNFKILKTKNSKNVYILRHKFKNNFFINTLFSTLETPTSSSQVIIVSGN